MNNFFHWLNSKIQHPENEISPERLKRFNQLKTIWDESGNTKIPHPPDTEDAWLNLHRAIESVEEKQQTQRSNFSYNIFKVPKLSYTIAMVLILVLSSLYFLYPFGPKIYSTDFQERIAIDLPDGSNVQLNSFSQITLSKNFNTNSREVLLKGEAFFKVKKGEVPFIISTEFGKVYVIGTSFNVNSRDDRIEVAVSKGTVEFTSFIENKDSTVTLSRNQISTCTRGTFPSVPQTIQLDQYPGWIYGRMTFFQTELKYIIKEIERQFNVSIILENIKQDNLKVSGSFDASDIDRLLSAVCLLVQKEYRYENKRIIIY